MPGIFEKLLNNFNDVAASFYQALDSASENDLLDPTGQQEISSITKFAQVDLLMSTYAEEQDGFIIVPSFDDATASVNKIVHDLTDETCRLAGLDGKGTATFAPLTFDVGSIRSAATNLEYVSNLIDIQTRKLPVGEAIDAQPPNTEAQKYLSLLHCALTAQLSANCGHKHVARLKLTGFTDSIDQSDQPFFDLFLSSRFDWTPCRWVSSRCIIERSLQKTEKPGCQLIEEAEMQKHSLHLHLGEQQVGSLLRGQGVLLCNPPIPTRSLGYLIDNNYFNRTYKATDPLNRLFLPSERAALCCTLARSLLHLSHGEWTRVNWQIDGIHFLEEPGTHRLLDKDMPYLSWTLEQWSKSDIESSHNPILVNFAQLLMEIYGGQRIQFAQPAGHIHSLLYEYVREINDSHVRSAVVACLGSEGSEAARDRLDHARLRDFIHQKVLQRLEANKRVYEEPWLDDDSTSMPSCAQLVPETQSMLSDQSPYDGKEYNMPESDSAAKVALKFTKQMKHYTQCHIQNRTHCTTTNLPEHLCHKIKIAIIDSGAQTKDTLIMGAKRSGRIREGRNFLPGAADQWNDTFGHGTHITRLLLEMAPEAELYIAKVTNGKYIEQDMVRCVADAINWAVQKWQVDIISLSLVMPKRDESVEAELKEAMNPSYEGGRRRLVFAAAGNTGGNAPVGWLASMPNIIAIHATDGLGDPANFNPTAWSGVSFATLGRDIQSQWKETDKRAPPKPVYLSGTSFATPIAAAIAANVLEWARWNLNLTKDHKKLLHSPGYMRKIFEKMMQPRSGYHYLQPWTLWDHGWPYGSQDKSSVKDVIRDIIAT